MLMILFFIDCDRDEYLGKSISRDMEIDEVTTSGLDMDSVWELDILFFESDIVFIIHSSSDGMLIETSEDFFSFSLEGEVDLLSIELFLYFECLLQSLSRLVLGFFLIVFDLRQTIWSDLSGESTGDERVAGLRRGDLYDSSFATYVGDI